MYRLIREYILTRHILSFLLELESRKTERSTNYDCCFEANGQTLLYLPNLYANGILINYSGYI